MEHDPRREGTPGAERPRAFLGGYNISLCGQNAACCSILPFTMFCHISLCRRSHKMSAVGPLQ